MKKYILLMALTVMALSCKKQPAQTTGINLNNLDTTQVATNDFYSYACGGWMKNNPLPAEYSRYGSFDQLAETNLKQLRELVEGIADSTYEHGTIEQKIADLYHLAADTARRNTEGTKALEARWKEIDQIANNSDLSRALGASLDYGFFYSYVDADAKNSAMNILNLAQGGFELGEKEYYIDQDEQTTAIRNAYQKHIENMFTLFGFSNADQCATTVLRLETRLARAAKNNVELRDPEANYNKMSIADLQALVPEIDWALYLQGMGVETDSLSVGQVAHLQEVGHMLNDEKLDDIKTLLRWQVMSSAAGYLTDEIYAESFDFYGRVLSGIEEQKPLWKRCVNAVDGSMGEALGQMYVARYFSPEAKERMVQLVKNLQTSLGERIDAQAWMSDATKARAHEKLNAFRVKVGYPDKWRDYTALDIDGSLTYYENHLRVAKFENDYCLSELNKPVDKDKWYMTPQTVNAYYNPSSNEICFPAGILQYPFFDMQADDAFNYGAIGVVIGHEMTHGFDDQGSQFDKDGNLVNWWTDEDKQQFEARTRVMADYFSSIEVAPGVHGNGDFTLGENIADHGGLMVSFNAFRHIQEQTPLKEVDGFTPEQRFFLSYANVWANNIRDAEILVRTKSDPHSLGRWRVNGALPHIGAWYEAWGVTESSPMFVPKDKRVDIW